MKHRYENYMTLKEWKEFAKNYQNTFSTKKNETLKEHLLVHNYSDRLEFYDMINMAFEWKPTPQGHDYWREIADRTKPFGK